MKFFTVLNEYLKTYNLNDSFLNMEMKNLEDQMVSFMNPTGTRFPEIQKSGGRISGLSDFLYNPTLLHADLSHRLCSKCLLNKQLFLTSCSVIRSFVQQTGKNSQFYDAARELLGLGDWFQAILL